MAFVTELEWLRDGEVASENILNRPLTELLSNDIDLQNNKISGIDSSLLNSIPVFSNNSGKTIKESLVTITDEGSLILPPGQNIMSGDESYSSGSGSNRFIRWMGL